MRVRSDSGSLVSDTVITLSSNAAVSGKSSFYFLSTCNTKAIDIAHKQCRSL